MILVDTGALYALANRRDHHHREAVSYFRRIRPREVLAIPTPVLVEAVLFLEGRLGPDAARALWDDVIRGVFDVLPVSGETLAKAREIDREYLDADLGFVDCVSLALCERHRIKTVFTYDRRDFALYRPSFVGALTLVP
ncbi:MAG: PIN domain-containing protein [Armatimonadota bacterium]|nr:PIN domain-containing protein [Armatimonadota bacterium]